MSVYYVDSAAGSNTSPYDTWAKAATSLATIAGIDAAGDTIYVASTHNETSATALSYSWSGTAASPIKIICADKTSGAPPTTAATGGTISTTGTTNLVCCAAGVIAVYGLTFNCGSGTGAPTLTVCSATSSQPLFDKCTFALTATGAAFLLLANGSAQTAWLRNCTYSFSGTGQTLKVAAAGTALIEGGTFSGSAINTWFTVGATASIDAFALDASTAAASSNVVSSTVSPLDVDIDVSKLPASWTGSANGSAPGLNSRVSLRSVDSSGTTYVLNIMDEAGAINQNTTVVMTGGATDGTTPLSWTLASNSQCIWPAVPLHSEWRAVWVDTTTSKTLTWNYVADTNVAAGQGAGTASAFQNNEVWIEALYLGASTSPLGTLLRSDPATPLTTASSNAAGSASWTTTGLTTPKVGCCTLTFTTAMKGPMLARICVGAASKTIYADPAPTFA